MWKIKHLLYIYAQSCTTLCSPMDYSPPGFSVRGIFQARILEWVVIYYSDIYIYIHTHTYIYTHTHTHTSIFSSVAQSCPTLCDPMNYSTPSLQVHHQLPELTQIHVHQVGNAIQPSHPLSSPSPPAANPSQHQGFFQWVNSSHEVAKVLEFQLQHQSFQWTPRTGLL